MSFAIRIPAVDSGNWDVMVRNVKAMADWLLKAHLKASDTPAENVFVGQVSRRRDAQGF